MKPSGNILRPFNVRRKVSALIGTSPWADFGLGGGGVSHGLALSPHDFFSFEDLIFEEKLGGLLKVVAMGSERLSNLIF